MRPDQVTCHACLAAMALRAPATASTKDAARWRHARQFLSIEDIERWSGEDWQGHHPEELESSCSGSTPGGLDKPSCCGHCGHQPCACCGCERGECKPEKNEGSICWRSGHYIAPGLFLRATNQRPAVLCMDGWAGRSEQPVVVVGETPKRYRIRATERTRLPGNRWIEAGETTLVPRYAVKFT